MWRVRTPMFMKNSKEMEVINFADTPSIVSRYMLELRDVTIQHDPMRFRANLDRIGQIMAYEISKCLDYKETAVETPLDSFMAQLGFAPSHIMPVRLAIMFLVVAAICSNSPPIR